MEEHEDDEIELQSKKLSGAPVESKSMFNKKKNNKGTIPNYHDSVLGRMYRN